MIANPGSVGVLSARLRVMARAPAALLQCPTFVLGLLLGSPSAALPQAPEGARVFQASCATCHTGARDSRAPSLDALRVRTPRAIIDSLLTGVFFAGLFDLNR